MRKRKRDGWYVLLMLFAMVGICWILQMKEVERQELSIQGGSAVLPENLVHLGNHSYRRVVTNGHIVAGELDGDMVVVREEEDISDPAQPGNVPVPEPVPEPGPGTSEVVEPGDNPEPQVVVTIGTTDMAYFDDALFIGDSRTVGIAEYGYLENADYFADVSMTVFKLFTAKLSVDGGEKVSLETALCEGRGAR